MEKEQNTVVNEKEEKETVTSFTIFYPFPEDVSREIIRRTRGDKKEGIKGKSASQFFGDLLVNAFRFGVADKSNHELNYELMKTRSELLEARGKIKTLEAQIELLKGLLVERRGEPKTE